MDGNFNKALRATIALIANNHGNKLRRASYRNDASAGYPRALDLGCLDSERLVGFDRRRRIRSSRTINAFRGSAILFGAQADLHLQARPKLSF